MAAPSSAAEAQERMPLYPGKQPCPLAGVRRPRDFRKHGEKAIAKVRRDQPGVYLKVLALLIPREHKVQHSNSLKDLTDEQLEAMIEYIKTSLEAQAGDRSSRERLNPRP